MVEEDAPVARRYLGEAADMALAAGNMAIVLFALGDLARLELTEGYLQRAVELCQQARTLGAVKGNTILGPTGIACIQMGEVFREWNQLDEAKSILMEGLALCKGLTGLPNIMLEGLVNLARVYMTSGDKQLAAETMQRAESLLVDLLERGSKARPMISLPMVGRLRYWLVQGKVDETARWLKTIGISVDAAISPGDLAYHILLVRVLVEQGHLEMAQRQLVRLAKNEEERQSPRLAVEISLLRALWLQEKGEEDRAVDMLARALRLAEPEGFINLFVDYGSSVEPMLRQVAGQRSAPANAKTILALMTAGQSATVTQPDETTALIEPLKDQELRILKLMAAGLTNGEIAAELFLSVNTIKTYTSRIYGKLGVHNRPEAVDRAHQLRLL